MARIEDTGGNITYTIDNCDCGLTGGCWKCQPIHFRVQRQWSGEPMYFFPQPHEEKFMDENLKEFYRKKGLLYSYEF